MKGKNILITAALVLGFGGIVANTAVEVSNNKALEQKLEDLKSELEAADSSNKAALKAEFTALIETTRDNLEASYKAADAALRQGLQQLQADLQAAEAQIAQINEDLGDSQAADTALANQIASKVGKLNEQLQEFINSYYDYTGDVSEAFWEISMAINDVYDEIDALNARCDAYEDAFEGVVSTLESFETSLNGLKETVVALGSALDALEQSLETNYYTISQVNNLVASINSAISTLTGLFRVNGTIVSMADLMTSLDAKFGAIDAAIATLQTQADASAAATALQDAIDAINDKLDAFYGDEAKSVKGQLANQLTLFYLQFKESVIDAKREQIKSANGGALPTEYVTLFENIDLLYETTLRGVLNEGMVRIVLAANVTEAAEMEAEFELRMQSVMFKVMYLAEQQMVKTNIEDLITTDCPVNFTSAIADAYIAQVEAVTFDDTQIANATAAEALVYYDGLLAQIHNVEMVAGGYNTLVNNLKAADAAIDAYSGLNESQKDTFKTYNNAAASFANYDGRVANAAEQADVDAAVAAIGEKFDVVDYGAQKIAVNNLAAAAAKDVVTGLTDLVSAEIDDINGAIDDVVDFAEYNTAFADILDDFNSVDEAKAEVDAIIELQASNIDVLQYSAEQLAELRAHNQVQKDAIDALTAVSAADKDAMKDAIDELTSFDLYKALVGAILGNYTAGLNEALDAATEEAKAAIDLLSTTLQNEVTVVSYAGAKYDALVTGSETKADLIDGCVDLDSTQKDGLTALLGDVTDFEDYFESALIIAESITTLDGAKADVDALTAAVELKQDLTLYGALQYNLYELSEFNSSSAIDALTNLTDDEKTALKAYNVDASNFSEYLAGLTTIVNTAATYSAGADSIDAMLVGSSELVDAVLFAATQYDAVKATEAANKAIVDAYTAISQDDKDALNGDSAAATTFADYNSALAVIFGDSFTTTTVANGFVSSLISDMNASLEHTKALGAAYNTLCVARDEAKAEISDATENDDLVANGDDALFNDYLDDLFNLASVKLATSNFSTDAEFTAYVSALEADMDNVVTSASVQNDMEAALRTTNEGLATAYTAAYQVAYFQDVATSAFGEYSMIANGSFKDGFDPKDNVAEIETAADGLEADLAEVVAGAASFKHTLDKGVDNKAELDGYIGTYESIFFGVCSNDNDDQVTVWAEYIDQIQDIEDEYCYLYGGNLEAVPTIAAGEDYATTKANFDAYIAALESDDTIDARFVAYKTAINALLPQMKADFHVYDLAYAVEVAKAAIGDNLDGTSGTLKVAFDDAIAAVGSDTEKITLLSTSYDIYLLEINNATSQSSAEVNSIIAAAVAYWATVIA